MSHHGHSGGGHSGGGHGRGKRQEAVRGRQEAVRGPRRKSGLRTRIRALRDWSVSSRLIAVIVVAVMMGLVFGGLRVEGAVSGEEQFGRVSRLAALGEQLVVLTHDLENERDKTASDRSGNPSVMQSLYAVTNSEAARVQRMASGIGSDFPANIVSEAKSVASDSAPGSLHAMRAQALGDAGGEATGIIQAYANTLTDLIQLNDQVAQGVSDSALADDVRTLNALTNAQEQASEQRLLLYNAFLQKSFNADVQSSFGAAVSEEDLEETAFQDTATGPQNTAFQAALNTSAASEALLIANFMRSDTNPIQDVPQIGLTEQTAPAVWYQKMSAKIDGMQGVGMQIAKSIAARAHVLQDGAKRSAWITAIGTLVVLLIVVAAAILVARSMVRPLERLRAAALDVAMTELPDRVRRIGETSAPEEEDDQIAPIDVTSGDEIGQVARAFDQVHRQAVRLASDEAMMRANFNGMFVNLSRRSQVLLERLARLIDSLEQAEEDPARLSNLFSMDHLVTRMRRNSENLLVLAGHEGARKRSESAPLADVVRAATSEIEQYTRVTLERVPAVFVEGQAVSDVAHLLAELIENATAFSPRETQVHVSADELSRGGVLVEISDSGIGISESRLTELNWRLDNPPVIDASVTRHMGLFAVGRLAQRHGVRVRLQRGSQQGLTALVWLPDAVLERKSGSGPQWEYPARPAAPGQAPAGQTAAARAA
ncbi:MAG: nitrate- and nitrite sensing domain-containing protein, partial [Nocardiopsaceae bacterium]|nr:nitrate- and nitrite sensing domain-containing protein [Nocardiopsaceae bacterium]